MSRWWESWRTAAAQDDGPFYAPEIGHHSAYGDIRDFINQTNDRVDTVQHAANQALGIRRPTPSPGGGGGRIETGHHVKVNLDYPSGTWYAAVSPPSWPHRAGTEESRENSTFLHLGESDEHVPQMLIRRLMHPQTQEYLRRTLGK